MDYTPPQTIVNPPAIEWRMQGAQRLDETVLRPLLVEDAQASGDAVAKAYKSRGILAVRVRIEGTNEARVLHITEGTIRAQGKYARYLPEGEVLTQDALDTAIARAQAEARANNEALGVRVGKVSEDGRTDVLFDGAPLEASNKRGSVSLSSFGPRYSGADVLSLAGYAALGNGYAVDGSITAALSDLRTDSKGGRYTGINAGLSKATQYGLLSLRGSYSDFKVGGANLALDQVGTVAKVDAEWSYALTPSITPYLGLGYTRQVSGIGLAGWEDTLSTTAAKAGVRTQTFFGVPHGRGVASLDVGVEQGLAASRTLDAPGPLLGDIDKHYQAATVDAALSVPVSTGGAILSLSAGGQSASEGTPSGAQFYAGGPNRGVSYHAGVYAAPSGYYAGAQLTSGSLDEYLGRFASAGGLHDIKAFVGLDGAQVRTAEGAHLVAKSAHLGMRFAIGPRMSGQVGYAAPIGGRDEDKARLTFFLVGTF